ncbi:hypothetical protein [Hydrogenophaga sp. IBVHS1]|uniref:hypothetical protein n=1 Tax=unclassified Hydrogenophaga TaxID=2610897 RepID=UPI000A2DDC3C|nr:hypothetical protein [Hydrogenophaga sp. IBVHS1]OSZ76007.1 hypothetical protein CAP37_11800 [Hydrogenophaga sp. IBVHS1]
MAKSSIQGVSPAPAEPAGRDTASLGPGDTSDSGSDMMGIEDSEGGDPGLATDVAARDELGGASLLPPDALTSTSDATGTGESRSAGGDSGKQDGWDIGVDRVFTPGVADADADAEEDPDLAFVDEAEAGDPLEDQADETGESGEADDGEDRKPAT